MNKYANTGLNDDSEWQDNLDALLYRHEMGFSFPGNDQLAEDDLKAVCNQFTESVHNSVSHGGALDLETWGYYHE